jgi:tetratricopeptide (TPR) repeat protein
MYDKRKIIGFASVSIVLISVYLYTIAPTVSLWDCGEFIACSHILGVPHPPGTPFFVLLGRIFDIIIPFGEVAKRINFFSSLSSALAGGFLYLIILLVFQRFRENRGKLLPLNNHLIAVFSAIGAGLSYSVWDTSVEAELYSTSILILVICLWLALQWDENRKMRDDDNYLLLLVYLIFLSFGIHLMPLLLIPGTLVFVIMTDRRIFNNPRLIIFSVFLILISITTYYYLMIRAHANPAINETDPSNFSALWDVISREQYGPMKMYPRKTQAGTNLYPLIAFFEQIKIFFKYFSWQYFPYPRESNINTLLKLTSTAGTYTYVLIGLWGMFIHYKKDRKSFYLFFILYLLLSLGLVFYLNLKFSPSDPNPAHREREVRERDYFWSPAFSLFMFYVAIGLYWIYERGKKINVPYGYAGITLSFLIGFMPLISNIQSHVNRRGNWIASDYAHNLLMTPEDYSILFTYGDNDTFPVWFLQEVKEFRKFDPENKKGIMLSNFSLMNTSWYIRQLKAAGIPMDFVSPFKGTNMDRAYRIKKRRGETNLEFEDWIINNIMPLKCDDGKWLRPADILVRNIILTASGIKPSLEDLMMPAEAFVSKYIKEDFNPSINIYFSFPTETYSMKLFGPHLELEGFAYHLVGKKEENMLNYRKMLDKLAVEFKTSYCENPTIYTGRAQKKPLLNHAYIYLIFGDYALKKFARANRIKVSNSGKDTLRMFETIFKRAFIFSMDSRFTLATTPQVANSLKRIYSLLGEEERAINFCDSLLSIKDTPSLHLLHAEMLTLKAKSKKENKEEFKEATKEFAMILNNEDFKPLGYRGLIELYSISNDSQKIKEIILEIRNDQKLLDQIIFLSINFDQKGAIKLLEIWKELYPDETVRVDQIIKGLKNRPKERF